MVLADTSLIERVPTADVDFVYDSSKHHKKVRQPVERKTLSEVERLNEEQTLSVEVKLLFKLTRLEELKTR